MVKALESAIKVIFVITGSGVGGAEKMLYHTIKGLNQERYTAKLCSLKKKAEFACRLEAEGLEVYSLNMRNEATLAGWFDSLRALVLLVLYFLRERPVIVHSFLFRANIIARIAGYLSGVPVIISSVRVMGGERDYHHFVDRLTAFMTDHFVAVSNAVKDHIVRKAHLSERKVSTIYNGIAVANSNDFDMSALMSSVGLKHGERIIMTAGRLHRQKGYDHLMQALSMVQESFPGIKLLILGDGEEEKNLKKLAHLLELTEKIVFLGLRSDVGHLLQCSELFVLPSRWEGFPNAVLEAMAAGKPVVATAVGGIPELVVDGVTGILVPPEDARALAEAIMGMLSHDERAKAMGEAGRQRVQQYFSMDAMIAKTEDLYHHLLLRKKPS
jgi:glycosyltransferase involved in cell wall biosynthesis